MEDVKLVPVLGKPTWRSLRLNQPLTQLWPLGIESTFMVDPMNTRILENICFNTTSRLAIMTMHRRLHHTSADLVLYPHDAENCR